MARRDECERWAEKLICDVWCHAGRGMERHAKHQQDGAGKAKCLGFTTVEKYGAWVARKHVNGVTSARGLRVVYTTSSEFCRGNRAHMQRDSR